MPTPIQKLLEGSTPSPTLSTAVLERRAGAPSQSANIIAPPSIFGRYTASQDGNGSVAGNNRPPQANPLGWFQPRTANPGCPVPQPASDNLFYVRQSATRTPDTRRLSKDQPAAQPAQSVNLAQPVNPVHATHHLAMATGHQPLINQRRWFLPQDPTLDRLAMAVGPVTTPKLNPKAAAFAPQFTPTTMARYGRGVQRRPTAQERMMRIRSGMSDNYRGDPGNIWSHSVSELPDHLNTAFWICHLPPDVTHHELLGAITGCGRIFCVHINNEEVGIKYDHAGAKLLFFDVVGATNFANHYMENQTLYVRGQRAKVRRNRNKIPQRPGLPPWLSRCLRIKGPKSIVNIECLFGYFDPLFEWETDDFITLYEDTRTAVVEFRFGSYQSQASMAYKILTSEDVFRCTPGFEV